jgi:hypothetical protein
MWMVVFRIVTVQSCRWLPAFHKNISSQSEMEQNQRFHLFESPKFLSYQWLSAAYIELQEQLPDYHNRTPRSF